MPRSTVFVSRPYGLAGGEPGRAGRLSVVREGETLALPAKTLGYRLAAGDIVRMETPGAAGSARRPSAIRRHRARCRGRAGHAG